MTSAGHHSQPCMRCGYQLVGPPLPTRCPECGYPVLYQSKWREGELHRAGPAIVWPVAKRFAFVAALLGLSVVASIILSTDALRQIHLVTFSTTRWMLVPFFLAAPVAAFVWHKSVNGPGSDLWGLHRQAALRRFLMLFGFWFWLVAFCVVEDLRRPASGSVSSAPASSSGSAASPWFDIATVLLAPALIGWTVVLLHVARVSLYLRNELLHRIWVFWAWAMPIGATLVLLVCWGQGSLAKFWDFLWIFTWFAMVLSAVLAALAAWDLAHCLTHCYETVAREERLAKQNAERYSTPQ